MQAVLLPPGWVAVNSNKQFIATCCNQKTWEPGKQKLLKRRTADGCLPWLSQKDGDV